MTEQNEKCNIYRVTPSGSLKSIIDDSVIVDREVMRGIDRVLSQYIRNEKVRKGEYLYRSSQTIFDPKITLDKR